jgi:hypothetical protein
VGPVVAIFVTMESEDLKKIKILNSDEGSGAGGGIDGATDVEYWRKDISEFKQVSNIVLIHVCDENR